MDENLPHENQPNTAPKTQRAFPFYLATSSTTSNSQKEQTQEEKDKVNCDAYVNKALTRDKTVQFLIERLVDLGCKPPPGFINCIDCGETKAGGGFGVVEERILPPPSTLSSVEDQTKLLKKSNKKVKSKTKGCTPEDYQTLKQQMERQMEGKTKLRLLPEIFLCQQHLVNQAHTNQSLVHELIHAIDLCRTSMDPINNCIHMACTEIRAENLSGECDWTREMMNGRMGNFKGHGAQCVKRRAALSVRANPNCGERAEDYVNVAFERCFKDTYPFDRHPNLR
jgi:inner membrane protease ATP23